MEYKRVSRQDVYDLFVGNSICVGLYSGSPLSARYIAERLKTSRYQAYKYIHQLVNEGFLEYSCEYFYNEEECYPPYCGFVLTNKGCETEYYKNCEKKEMEEIERYIDGFYSVSQK